jgi:tetratricopeptide (TPR) repeat protein
MIMKTHHRRCCIIFTSVLLLTVAGCATKPPQQLPGAPAKPSAHRSEDPTSPTRLAGSFDEAVRRGDAAWQAGNTDLALYLYVQALSFQPRDVSTLGKIGYIHRSLGNLDLARKAFELAAATAPDDTRATSQLGFVLFAQEDMDGADKWLRKSLAGDTTNWRVYDALGLIAQRHGQYDDALEFLQRATVLAPGEPGPLLHQGGVQLAKAHYAEAEVTLQQSLERKPTSDAWRLLGEAQAHRGEYAKAVASLLQASDVPAAYNTVGQVAMANHDNRIALDYFEKAAESSPVYFPDAQRNAALARQQLKTAGASKP